MSFSQKQMSIGPFTLGTWLYDCNRLKSRTLLRKNRPGFRFEITVGKSVKETLVSGLKVLPNGIGDKIGDTVSKTVPDFSGSIIILTDAEPVRLICDPETKKQAVGWDYVISVLIRGKVKTAAAEVMVAIDLPFAGEGDRVQCDCNSKIDLETFAAANVYDVDPGIAVGGVGNNLFTMMLENKFNLPVNSPVNWVSNNAGLVRETDDAMISDSKTLSQILDIKTGDLALPSLRDLSGQPIEG